ncbi:MAG: YdcH family protein [Arcobacteraceae bacterium]|jgi:uncharacterized protein YdcH (DUF465 family)|nr:YdcH family protein [Arcobacteraceae bacterium]MDY0328370.1 YdcH family protein [Arcobacteraceae bacterium]
MFHEYRDIVTELKTSNAHFAKVFEKHNDLDDKIADVEAGREHMEHFDLEVMKKEKLRLKDEAHQMILDYKKENDK